MIDEQNEKGCCRFGRKDIWIAPLAAAIVLSSDAASKQWALSNLSDGTSHPTLAPLFGFTLLTNSGTAFGMWRSYKFVGFLLPPVICAVIVWWIWYREKHGRPLSALEKCGFGLILGGALGNIIDRFMRGYVTDFIYFVFWPSFPVFNIADACIDVGVALILAQSLLNRPHVGQPIASDDTAT